MRGRRLLRLIHRRRHRRHRRPHRVGREVAQACVVAMRGPGAIASTNATWSNSTEDVADSNNHQFDATGIPTFSCGYNLGCSVGE
jgi:hypothetical protein